MTSEEQLSVWKLWIKVKSWQICAPVPKTHFVQTGKHFSILCTFGELFGMQVRQNVLEITMKDCLSPSKEKKEDCIFFNCSLHQLYLRRKGMMDEVLHISYSLVAFSKLSTRHHLCFSYGNECWWDNICYNHKHSFSKKYPHGRTNYTFSDYPEGWLIHSPSDSFTLSNGFKLIKSILMVSTKLGNTFWKVSFFAMQICAYVYINRIG